MAKTKADFDAAIADLHAEIGKVESKDTAQEAEKQALLAQIADLEAQLANGGLTPAEEEQVFAAIAEAKARLAATTGAAETPGEEPPTEPGEDDPTEPGAEA